MGVAAFNAACRESVLRYTDEWRDYVTRQARWVDFDNDYKTLDLDYMEIGHVGLQDPVGQGPGLPGLPGALVLLALTTRRCRPRDQDGRRLPRPAGPGRHRRAAPVRGADLDGAQALVWTTTPWTLPSTSPIAVTPDVDYVVVEADGERYVLAARAARRLRPRARRGADVLRTFRGTELLGLSLHAAVRLLRRPAERAPRARGRLRHHRGRHRHRPHRARVRRGGQGRHATRRASRPSCRSTPTARSTPPCRPYEGMHVFDANNRSSATSRSRQPFVLGGSCATTPTTTRTRTAGAAATR